MDELKLFGPVQLYDAPGTNDAVRFKFVPSQTGELFDTPGVAGIVLTITEVVAEVLVHCPTVTVTAYEPAFATVILLITGFCNDELNPFGPVQLYVAPGTVDANKFNALPSQTGELLVSGGALGTGAIITVPD